MITHYLVSLGFVPYFASRAFVPLFASACVARWGAQIPLFDEAEAIEMLGAVPPAFTSDLVLGVLLLFAVFEIVAQKSPELRELASLYENQVKAAAGFAATFALVWGHAALVESGAVPAITASMSFGESVAYLWSGMIAGAILFASMLRNAIFGFLREIDQDDDLGIQGLLSWLEDAIGFFGVLFVVVLPVVSVILAGLTVLGLDLTRRYLEYREEKSKVPCANCDTSCSPCGIRCPGCGHLRRDILQVGVLGTIRTTRTADLMSHRLQLLAQKRCSSCGDRLKERLLEQSCLTCGTRAFSSAAEVETYLGHVRSKLPKILVVLFVMSAIPLVGLVAGVIYYRLSVIASLRCYVPRSTGFVARWVVRIVNLILLCLQPVPILGAFVLPLMCLTNYGMYQALLRRQVRSRFAGSEGMAPSLP